MVEETQKETLEKKKALENALTSIERRFGKGSIMPLKRAEKVKVDVIPTGSLALDIATGIGGIPKGRVIEIFGPESSGKTTLALHIIAEAQKRGGIAVFIDAEHALDPKYAEHINYVDRLKKSLRDGEAFSHKKCTECAFGKLFLFGDMAQQGPISIGDFRPFGKHRKASLRFSSKGL